MRTTEKKYSIVKDRVETYRDFTMNLLYYIYDYYLDSESLGADQDIKNHFNWCYDKVSAEFLKEELDFTKNDDLREYFHTYFYYQFYSTCTFLPSLHAFGQSADL